MTTPVSLQRKTQERNDRTGEKERWDPFAAAYCGVEITPGGETDNSGQMRAKDSWKLETTWTPTVGTATARDRVQLTDGQLLEIKSAVNEHNANRAMIFICEATT